MKGSSSIWAESRYKVGKSQEYMAMELGIARKTVQNWEKGVSSPTVDEAMQWFQALNLNPLPYLYQYIFPSMENIKGTDSDDKIREALFQVIQELPSEMIRELLFLFYGDHGSSPRGVLQLMTAHLQTPMRDRVTVAGVVEKNYEIAMKKGNLSSPDHVQPDLDFLKAAIKHGEEAFIEGKEAYVVGADCKK